jgi:aspartyl-tRNA(Asn)/glutamyl-tRNA(Gln) amidotransferase subunit B
MSYEPVIGLEAHAQLLTDSKLFCGCSTAFGAAANVHTCEICLGMPGVLPVLNRHAVELALRAALGLSCTVHCRSQWSRKNYFYPDLPKGYQISQYDQPLATNGYLDIEIDGAKKRIGITRIHLEEDAGKNVHDEALAGARSYVDFNRGGTPLIEIVSEPDLRSAGEAATCMRSLRQILRYLGVCDGNMEQGSLRCDANVSVRPSGSQALGIRTELKNINSFRFVKEALDFEIARQTAILSDGGTVEQETRLWDSQAKVTRSMRSKEEAHDYRYFPDPDLPDLHIDPAEIEQVHGDLPELPGAKVQRYTERLGISSYDAAVLTEDPEIASYFEAALAQHNSPKAIANWILNDLLREAAKGGLEAVRLRPAQLAELVALIEDNTISGKIAKDIFAEMISTGGSPKAIVSQKGLTQVTDLSRLEAACDEAIAASAAAVAQFKSGKTNAIGFLVGQVMKQTGGKANPKLVNEILRRKLT